MLLIGPRAARRLNIGRAMRNAQGSLSLDEGSLLKERQAAMQGIYAVRAVHAAPCDRHDWRRTCVSVVAALLGMLHTGNDCIAVHAIAEGRAEKHPVAVDADPAIDVNPDAPILSESGRTARTLLLAAADRVAQQTSDPSPVWFDHIDEARRDSAIDSRVGKIITEARIFLVDGIDHDSLRVHLPADDFAENGPGTLRLSVAGLDIDSGRSVAGGRMQLIAAQDDRGRFLLETRLSWMFEYLQTEVTTTAFFMPGEKGIFAVQGLRYGANWAIVGGGLRWEFADGWSAYAGYDAQVKGQQLFHIGSGGLGYAW